MFIFISKNIIGLHSRGFGKLLASESCIAKVFERIACIYLKSSKSIKSYSNNLYSNKSK